MHKDTSTSQQIQLYIRTNCSKSKKVIAYARSHCNKVITVNLCRTKSTGTIWHNILSKLDKSPKEILDKSMPYYQKNIKGRDFDARDWTVILMNNPELLRSPIAIKGATARILDNPTDIYKM
jgi:arsenate reductase